MINARLPDGRILHFPDGTDPAVVQAAVRRAIAQGRSATSSATPAPTPDAEEAGFRRWYGVRAAKLGLSPDPDDPEHHYDYRAAFRAGAEPDASGHWPSKFKAADHPNRYIDGIDTITGEPARSREFFESGQALDTLLTASPLDPIIARRQGMEARRQAAVAAGGINPPDFEPEPPRHPLAELGTLVAQNLKEQVAGPVIGLAERGRENFRALAREHPLVAATLGVGEGDLPQSFGPLSGVRAMTELVPEGSREKVRETFEREREGFLERHPTGAGPALWLGSEFAANLAPFAPGATKAAAGLGQGAARLAGRLAPETFEAGSAAARMLARATGGAAEATAVGLGNVDPNLPLAEQARQVGFYAAIGAGAGGVGATREVAKLADQGAFYPNGRLRHGPQPPDPKLREQVLGIFEADRAKALQAAQEGAPPDATPSDLAEIQTGAVRGVETRWQPILAQAGAAGDEALGGLADRMQGALAPEIKAPPLRSSPRTLSLEELQAIERGGHRSRQAQEEWLGMRGRPEDVGELARTALAEGPAAPSRPFDALADEALGGLGLRPVAASNPEAGFLRIGRNKPPAPPASPIEAVMPRNEPPAPGGGPLARLQAIADRVTDQWFNRQDAPVRRVRRAGQHRLADELEMLTLRARGAGGMIDPSKKAGPVYEGTYVYDASLKASRRTGDGLQAIVGGMDDQALFDLDQLLVAERHMELTGRAAAGDPIQIDPRGTAIAQQTLADLDARYGTTVDAAGRKRVNQLAEVADKFRDWTVRAWMIPLKEAGRFTDQEFHFQMAPDGTLTYGGDILAKNDFYAPFQRLMEVLGDEGDAVYGLPPITSGAANPVHAISGGLSPDLPILRPTQSGVELAQKAVYWTERQRVRNAFADAVDSTPELQVEIRKVPPKPGRGPKTGLPLQQRGSFAAWKDGTRSEYAAPPDVLRAFEVLTPKQAGIISSAAALAARTLRAGATITLEFPFRNLGRDTQDAAVYGPGFNPIYKVAVDPIAGLFEVMGNKKWAREWRANGGALSGGVAVGRPQIEATLRDVARGGSAVGRRYRAEMANTSLAGKVLKTLAFPALAPMEALAGTLESANKVGAHRRMRLRGLSATEAATRSRSVASPDFGGGGSTAKTWNQYEAFFTAELGDLYRLGKAFRRAPGTTAIKALTYLTLPAIANWYKNKDDKQYQDLPEWERVAFYHVAKLDNGRYVRIPRPLGLINLAFSYGPQKFLEAMGGQDYNAAEEFGRSLIQGTPLHYIVSSEHGLSLDVLPSVAQPAIEAAAGPGGWSSFREGPIVPQALQGLVPEERVMDQTSGIARAVGGAVNMAPLKVDYLIQGYGAYWGRTLAQLTAPAARLLGADEKQENFLGRLAQGGSPELPIQASDIPGVRGFVSTPAIGWASDPVQRFYQISTMAMEAKDSLNAADKRGDAVRLKAIMRDHPEVALADMLLESRKELNDLRKAQKEMLATPGLTPEQRLEQKLMYDQLASAIAGVKMHQVADYLRGHR